MATSSSFAKQAVFYACEAYTDQLRAGQGYSDVFDLFVDEESVGRRAASPPVSTG